MAEIPHTCPHCRSDCLVMVETRVLAIDRTVEGDPVLLIPAQHVDGPLTLGCSKCGTKLRSFTQEEAQSMKWAMVP